MAADVGTLVMNFKSNDAKLMGSISALTKGMVGLGAVGAAALVGIGGASLKTAAVFEQGMSKVQAITDSTDEQMQKLEETAKGLGASTAFSAKEAAEGMAFLGMAGFDTNQIISAMPGLLDLAAASGTDLAVTADIVSDALSAFKLEAGDTGKFADILAKASASANVSVLTLGESFKFAAPVAGALGFSVEDVTAALGAMGNKGIKASQAGTALRTAMTKMAIAAEDSDSALQKMGIELTNSDGSMKDLSDIMNQLQSEFSTMTDAQKASSAEMLFGKNAMTGMLAIIDDSAGTFDSLVGKLNDSEGAAKKMADTMLDNLAGQMTLLKSATEGIAIEIGQVLIPVFVKFAKFISDNMPLIKEVLTNVFETIVSTGKLVWEFIDKNLMPVFKNMFSATKEGLDIMGPVFKNTFDKIVEVATSVWDFFRDNLLPGFISLFEWAKDSLPVLQEQFNTVFNKIVEIGKVLWTFFKDNILPIMVDLFNWVVENMPFFQEIWERVFGAIIRIITPIWEFIKDRLLPIFASLYGWISDNMPLIKSIVKTAFDVVATSFELVATVVETLFDWIGKLWDFMQPVFNEIGTLVGDAMTDILSSINFVIDAFKNLIGWVDDAITAVKEFFSAKDKGDLSTPRGSGGAKTVDGLVIKGHRALGGAVEAGQSYITGEVGAEVFTPSVSGTITPAGPSKITINVNGVQDPRTVMTMVVAELARQGVT